jgi:hypothetical protein
MKLLFTITMVFVVIISLATFGSDEDEPYVYEPGVIPHELKPIKPLNPIGTTDCNQIYVCNSEGDCKWITICQ